MDRPIHDIYDVILKLIALIWATDFLKFLGIDGEIVEILNTEIITLNGKHYYLDFLCRLKDGTLLNIEFQFPKLKNKDCPRFYEYNIVAWVTNQWETK